MLLRFCLWCLHMNYIYLCLCKAVPSIYNLFLLCIHMYAGEIKYMASVPGKQETPFISMYTQYCQELQLTQLPKEDENQDSERLMFECFSDVEYHPITHAFCTWLWHLITSFIYCPPPAGVNDSFTLEPISLLPSSFLSFLFFFLFLSYLLLFKRAGSVA